MNESILWKRGAIPKVIGVIHRPLGRNEKGLSKEKRRFFPNSSIHDLSYFSHYLSIMYYAFDMLYLF